MPSPNALTRLGFAPENGTLVMGVLNVTPDSFSDGGLFDKPEKAFTQARTMLNEGADMIDIGAESSRPGHTPIGAEEEWVRLQPVLDKVKALDTVFSVDTQKAEVASKALEALRGRRVIINDVWGLQGDARMAATVAGAGAPTVIMHNRESAQEGIDIIVDIHRFFEESLRRAREAGIEDDRIILDPGIGFGKTIAQNPVILKRLPEFQRYGLPILVGASRKRFIGQLLNAEVRDRLYGSLGAHLAAAAAGADIIRAHDVRPHVEALRVLDAVTRAPEIV